MKRVLSLLLVIAIVFCTLSSTTTTVYADYDANLVAHQKIDNILQNYVDPSYHLDNYTFTESEETELRAVAEEAIADCTSEYEKISAVTRYVAENIYYDYDYYEGRTSATCRYPYEVWTNKRAVCAGYARLTKALLNFINIPCMYVSADNHAYNVAYDSENDRWIYFDATWCSGNKYSNGEYTTGSYKSSRFDMSLGTLSLLSNHEFYDLSGIVVDGVVYSIETPNTADEWSNTGEWYAFVYGVTDNFNSTGVDIVESFDEVLVTIINDYAFDSCSILTSITIPDSVKSIGSDAFYNCTNLTSVIIGNSVTSIGYGAFWGCSSLSLVTIPDSVTSIGSYAFYNCTNLGTATIGNSVTSIGSSAFSGCTSLISIKIPDSVTSIGDSAFYGCSGLYSITIPDFVTNMGSSVFRECKSLTSIVIPDSVTGIGNYAFYNCTNLASVIIGNSVTNIGSSAFRNCTSLSSITIPESVTSIGNYAFYNCTNLTSSTIGNGVTNIGDYAFGRCTSLSSVTIPDSVTNIGSRAFETCTLLALITIGNNVTSIGSGAFYGCKNLSSIVIPESVTSIGSSAIISSTKIYCYENSTAHNYAVNNSRSYTLISFYSENEMVNIDYLNNVIFSYANCCTDFSEFVSTSEDFELDMCESSTAGDTKLYGTGSKVNISIDDNVLDEYTVITVGDLNGDSVCDVLDASVAQLYSSGLSEPTQNEIYAANGCIAEEIDATSYQNVVNTCLAS